MWQTPARLKGHRATRGKFPTAGAGCKYSVKAREARTEVEQLRLSDGVCSNFRLSCRRILRARFPWPRFHLIKSGFSGEPIPPVTGRGGAHKRPSYWPSSADLSASSSRSQISPKVKPM